MNLCLHAVVCLARLGLLAFGTIELILTSTDISRVDHQILEHVCLSELSDTYISKYRGLLGLF